MPEKIRVLGDVTHLPNREPLPAGWRVTSLAEMGEEAFADLMLRASEGDPFDATTPETALEDLRELIDAAGDAFVAERRLAVSDDDGPLGVVLPQPFPKRPRVGTIFSIGVVPERRRAGVGRRLHRFGLVRPQALGGEQDAGSTDPANAAMCAVCAANRCVEDTESS